MAVKEHVEAVLFITARPLTFKRLAAAVDAGEDDVRSAVTALATEYQERGSGLALVVHGGEVQLVTTPAVAATVQRFLKAETTGELTRPSLETLTIVAYRGPITRADLERIRGVNCSIILRNLMVRGLVQEHEGAGSRPSTYGVSVQFLRHLGLTTTAELPEYDALHAAEVLDRFLAAQAR
jgi:segregation and condensation protein B